MALNEALWDFPHTMNLKIMGLADAPLEPTVVDILNTHLEDFDPASLTRKPSSKGKFVSLTATVTLHNREQVEAIYRDLKASPHVKFTL